MTNFFCWSVFRTIYSRFSVDQNQKFRYASKIKHIFDKKLPLSNLPHSRKSETPDRNRNMWFTPTTNFINII